MWNRKNVKNPLKQMNCILDAWGVGFAISYLLQIFILKEWTLTLPICVGFGFVLGGVLKPLFEKVGALLSTNPKDDLPQWEISRKKKSYILF